MLACFLAMILLLPFIAKFSIQRSVFYKPMFKIFLFFFVLNCLVLGWIGGQPVISPYYELGQFATFLYFFSFFLLMVIGLIEQMIALSYFDV
jgi:ubiquinol-cytochrome c reductase cytochrome b subunit